MSEETVKEGINLTDVCFKILIISGTVFILYLMVLTSYVMFQVAMMV